MMEQLTQVLVVVAIEPHQLLVLAVQVLLLFVI
jgi:hypothetical protein